MLGVALPGPDAGRRGHRPRRASREIAGPPHQQAVGRPDPAGALRPGAGVQPPTCSCSTSRPSPSTSRPGARSGPRCATFAAGGRTVVFATHYLEEADAFADRIVLMADGRGRRRRLGDRDQGHASGAARSGRRCPASAVDRPGRAARRHRGRAPRRHGRSWRAPTPTPPSAALLAHLPRRPRHRDPRRRASRTRSSPSPPRPAPGGAGMTAERRPDRTGRRPAHATYVRYELLRTFRNRRFFVFSLVFPLMLFLLDRRAEQGRDARRHRRSPRYYMAGMVVVGHDGCGHRRRGPHRRRAHDRLEPPAARQPPVRCARTSRPRCWPATSMAVVSIAVLYVAGIALGRAAVGRPLGRDDGADPGRPDPVRRARHPPRPPADGRLDGPGDRRRHVAVRAARRGVGTARPTSGALHAVVECLPSYWLVQAGQDGARRRRLAGRRPGSCSSVWTVGLTRSTVRAYRRDTGRV